MKRKFFSRENIYSALWTILIGVIGFIAALMWKEYTGPDKVIVTRDENFKGDTTVTIVKFEGDSAAIEAFRNYNPKLAIDSQKESKQKNIATIIRPKFTLPPVVEGYIKKPINSFASVDIPRITYTRNEFIEVQMNVFDESTLAKISPVFIEIIQEKDKSITLFWEEQFKLKYVNNYIRFSSDFAKGKYLLTIGFYLMDELNTKYPPRYFRTYSINII